MSIWEIRFKCIMQAPLVSVVVPTYNRSQFLKKAVASVLGQTFSSWELIVVDDGSTDDSAEVIAEIASQDERIQGIFLLKNQGVSLARNAGIKKSSGTWICFLDSDDSWLPEKLEMQIDAIVKSPEVRVLQTDEIWIRNGVRVNPLKKHQKYSGWIFEKCIPLCIVSPSAVMIHREVFDRCGLFDETLPACEDYDLWLRIALEYPILTMSQKLIFKTGGHEDQLSRKYWGMDRFRLIALEKILHHPCLSEDQKKLVQKSIEDRTNILKQGAQKRGHHYEKTSGSQTI